MDSVREAEPVDAKWQRTLHDALPLFEQELSAHDRVTAYGPWSIRLPLDARARHASRCALTLRRCSP